MHCSKTAGKFLAGRLMSEADSSVQVELDSGKRVKVKAANVLLRFDAPQPAELIARAQTLAQEIDLDLAWEFAPDAEFGFADLARDYFEATAGTDKQAAALFRLFEAPHYFRRLGKGMFKKAPEDTVKAALLGIERKKQQAAADRSSGPTQLVAGECPAPIREQLYRILFKPDKNGPEYKAVVEATRRAQRAPLDLLKAAGAIDSPYQFHWKRFLFETFPKGTAFPAARRAADQGDAAAGRRRRPSRSTIRPRPRSTTRCRCRAWAAARWCSASTSPRRGWRSQPDSALDKVARERLSTVYMPGWKLTMLPDAVVQAYTLTAGQDCAGGEPVRRRFDEATLAVKGSETKLERVRIVSQPAPRPARQRHHRGLAHAARRRPTTPMPPSWPLPSAWRGT